MDALGSPNLEFCKHYLLLYYVIYLALAKTTHAALVTALQWVKSPNKIQYLKTPKTHRTAPANNFLKNLILGTSRGTFKVKKKTYFLALKAKLLP